MDFIQRSRHGTVYHFRRRVPKDLAEPLGRGQIVVSLHTEVRTLALRRARALLLATDDLFRDLRLMGKPRSPQRITTNYGIAIEWDPASGALKSLEIKDATPEDAAAIDSHIRTLGDTGKTPAASTLRELHNTPTIAEATLAVLGDSNLKATTRKRYGQVFKHFGEHFGSETRLADIPQERFAQYADAVNAALGWSIKTKNMYVESARRLFTYYEARNGAVPSIKTAGLKLKRQTPAQHDRGELTLETYRIVFANAAQYRKREPHKWWVTIACAFLGCRLEELVQAHLATDFVKDADSGIWYLKIDEDVDAGAPEISSKSVKSLTSWRRVPIHPAVIRAGLLDYLDQERSKGATTPFGRHWSPLRDRTTGGVKHSHPVTKWGSSELKKLVSRHPEIPADVSYFHSMRHGFVTLLAKAGVAEEWRAALVGHRAGGMNAQVYNKARHDVATTLPYLKAGLKPLAAVLQEVVSDADARAGVVS